MIPSGRHLTTPPGYFLKHKRTTPPGYFLKHKRTTPPGYFLKHKRMIPPDTTTVDSALQQARAALERIGILLFSDPALPSLVGMIVDEPLRTSWWGHPRGHLIYEAMSRLDDDASVLSTKLVAGKVTYVHRRLWPALVTLGTARESWQLDGLSAGAAWLLGEVEATGHVQTDTVVLPNEARSGKRVADAARELERRLLVHAAEIHTASGAHAKVLQSWPRWAAEVTLPRSSMTAAQAKETLEEAGASLAVDVEGGVVELPWRPRPKRRPKVFPADAAVRHRE
jgi:hypothetical protein